MDVAVVVVVGVNADPYMAGEGAACPHASIHHTARQDLLDHPQLSASDSFAKMGKRKQTKKFAQVKRMLNPNDQRL